MARFFEADERFVFDQDVGDVGLNPDQLAQISNALSAQSGQSGQSSDTLEQVTLPAIAATANDLALPTGTSFRLLTSGGAQTITGFANNTTGRHAVIFNVGANNITLANENAGSAEQNRIITGTGGNVVIQPDRSALLVYDGTDTRWRLISFT